MYAVCIFSASAKSIPVCSTDVTALVEFVLHAAIWWRKLMNELKIDILCCIAMQLFVAQMHGTMSHCFILINR